MIAKQKQALKIRHAGAAIHKDFAGADNCIHMDPKHIIVCNTITYIWVQNTFV